MEFLNKIFGTLDALTWGWALIPILVVLGCRRRSKTEPPCRLNREPGVEVDAVMVDCG